jgi:hypothetical protein
VTDLDGADHLVSDHEMTAAIERGQGIFVGLCASEFVAAPMADEPLTGCFLCQAARRALAQKARPDYQEARHHSRRKTASWIIHVLSGGTR